MPEYCDNCGTELDPSQARHQRYMVEHVSEDVATLEGAFCSDCFYEFEAWLDAA
ncbi:MULTISPECIES: hypothetical protein [Haloarcula]|uniref:Small CPxCG-related zinc finger protein n=1 Tax=Haloarcula pellucida TaxID=1427151 RepID=A0A830GM45_9EURY|nr:MULTISPECIES: hypothetical protein [Halomicroarcula]MBX0348514.1 hypothetical protein [Halomicroarcula pellucida]MDS0278339.1 hypothetical protein [Halomicroarcula sp. S1AR25-4]GGN92995.1 hypothetical protein GCM10009030_17930 [Halomicroarcula pellucida]